MDRALYIAASGATQTLKAQAVNHHNLANASTVGFRAELAVAGAVAVQGPGLATRYNAQNFLSGTDASAGFLQTTGNATDVALIDPNSWLAVQGPNGEEAYTRAGDLTVDAQGTLRNTAGYAVMGGGGPLTLPPATSISIGADGTVSGIPLGGAAGVAQTLGKIKVVEAKADQLVRANNSLFKAAPGVQLGEKTGAVLRSGVLESSNVNAADSLVTMIELARNFELQTRAMKAADENAQIGASILQMK